MIDKDKFKEAIYNSKKYIEPSYSETLKSIDMDKLDEGVDWINWWLYEKEFSWTYTSLEAKDSKGNIIPTDTVDDLWELVKIKRI